MFWLNSTRPDFRMARQSQVSSSVEYDLQFWLVGPKTMTHTPNCLTLFTKSMQGKKQNQQFSLSRIAGNFLRKLFISCNRAQPILLSERFLAKFYRFAEVLTHESFGYMVHTCMYFYTVFTCTKPCDQGIYITNLHKRVASFLREPYKNTWNK